MQRHQKLDGHPDQREAAELEETEGATMRIPARKLPPLTSAWSMKDKFVVKSRKREGLFDRLLPIFKVSPQYRVRAGTCMPRAPTLISDHSL
jgi:hypothetical protein